MTHFAAMLCLSLMLFGCRPTHSGIVVGSKNFTEQAILGELLSQYLEAHGFKVERRFYLAGTYVCNQALLAGRIDTYVEYTGTALTAIFKQAPPKNYADAYERVKQAYAKQGITVTEPLGFNNSFAMVIRGSDARQLHVRTISDFVPYAPQRRLGVGYEFLERADGYEGLVKTYGLHFAAPPRVMDLGLLYRALTDKQVDMLAASETDGLIPALDLVALHDDRHYFPPYDAVPVVRNETLQRYSGLREALAGLAGKITEGDMRSLNYAVDAQHRDTAQVVHEFLLGKKLLRR
jgi:osmoprotectant transport system substrate-binding protein